MTTWRQEIYKLVRPVADQRMFLFKEDSQTAWKHAYEMRFAQEQSDTTLLLNGIIDHPELQNDDLFEPAMDEVLDDLEYYFGEDE